MEAAALVREHYRAIDAGDYDDLTDLPAPGFVHERPCRNIEGRETFVGFVWGTDR